MMAEFAEEALEWLERQDDLARMARRYEAKVRTVTNGIGVVAGLVAYRLGVPAINSVLIGTTTHLAVSAGTVLVSTYAMLKRDTHGGEPVKLMADFARRHGYGA